MPSISKRLANVWNIFHKPFDNFAPDVGTSYGRNPIIQHYGVTSEHTFVGSLYNRIAMDVSSINIRHVRIDRSTGDYLEDISGSTLNDRLELNANIDQTGRALIQDLVLTMFEEGCAAIVPIDTDTDPSNTESYKIYSMRVGKIVEWYPQHVKVNLWNDRTGERSDLILEKDKIAIVQNPFYSVMNEPNSNLQRLIRKLKLLDVVDENNSSGKLDLIVQFPYTIKSEARRSEAERRRRELEEQLTGSKYGIAYMDGTERITQLNRAVENNLLTQIQYLTPQVYGQLGISESVMNGTADEQQMLNYYTRTIDPIMSAICDSMSNAFLSKTARSQGQIIKYFRDPFRLVPVKDLAEVAQKFTASEILSSNEIRSILFRQKSEDPNADMLRNPNINVSDSGVENESTDESLNPLEGDYDDEM